MTVEEFWNEKHGELSSSLQLATLNLGLSKVAVIKVNHQEKQIDINDRLTIAAIITEYRTIAGIKQKPAWELIEIQPIQGTTELPEDVEVNIATSDDTYDIAKKAMSKFSAMQIEAHFNTGGWSHW